MWTQDRVQRLTALWADGLSASQIAGELGNGLTRNAVIGKVHRINLPARAPRQPGRVRVHRPRRDRAPRLPRPHIKPNRFQPQGFSARQDQCAGMTKSQIDADFAAIWRNTVALQNAATI